AGTGGTNYVLRFASSPLTSVDSNNVTVSAASKLGVTTQPAGAAAGALLSTQPVVAIQTSGGATVASDSSTQVSVSASGGTLTGTTTVTAVSGLATFTNLVFAGTAGTNYTLHFTSSPALTATDSGNFTVTLGAANKLGIQTT